MFSETRQINWFAIFQMWLTQLHLEGFLTCSPLKWCVCPVRKGTLERGDGKSTHLLLAQTPHQDGSRALSSSVCTLPFPLAVQNSTLLLCTKAVALAMPPWQPGLSPDIGLDQQLQGAPAQSREMQRPRDAHTWKFYCWKTPMAFNQKEMTQNLNLKA